MELGLKGKVALVTGASKGIGKAAALELAREGCRLVVSARGEEELQVAAEEIRGTEGSPEVLAVAADVTNASDVGRLVQEAADHFGTVDVLVNNAGGVGRRVPFHELSDDEWFEILDLNLVSAARVTRTVLPYMREQGWGRIINVGSESGHQPDAVKPHYNASKAALVNLTKGLSKAYGKEGILFNIVSPATTLTPAVEKIIAEEAGSEAAFVSENRPNILAGRLGRSEEVAAVIAFLASERASFVAGSNYRVDSGSVGSIN